MAYHSRKNLLENGCMFHVTWQCHNKSFFLKGDFEKQFYYDRLLKYKNRYGVDIYSYCLMSNHVHIVGRCEEVKRLSGFMHRVNSEFSKMINKKLKRTGQVIRDRYKSPMIEDTSHLFIVTSYVELNAFRAKMVVHPKEYKWCSYNYYAFGKENKLVTESPFFHELGGCAEDRRKNYIDMMDVLIEAEGGVKKENYSVVYYIGTPAWVKDKHNRLKQLKKEKQSEEGVDKIKLSREDVFVT